MSIIKRQRVTLEPYSPIADAGGACLHEKSVRVLKREGKVMALELTCSCGEITVVEFDDEGGQVMPSEPLPEEEAQ